jgi:MerR family Zn(II)-responsive transcriptional regulator of zntA
LSILKGYYLPRPDGGWDMGLTVREVSGLTGIPIDSLRYYDREGLVSPKRGRNKYRYSDERDLVLLQYVVVMKYASFSLAEIKSVLNSTDEDPDEECARRNIDIVKNKREELLVKIENYKEVIKEFDEMIDVLEGNDEYGEKEKIMDSRIQKIFDVITKQEGECPA